MENILRDLPSLSRLRPFEAAARLESFTRAATELGLTQTAVSKQIAALELELGVLLFDRRNRAVFLTDEGRRFGRVVSGALADIAAEASLLGDRRKSIGVVLHCQLCEAIYWLMPRLSDFHERHPSVEVRIVTSVQPITKTSEAFDMAIQSTGRPSGAARLLFTAPDEVYPICAPSLIDNQALPLSPNDLSAFPLLAHRVAPQEWMEWHDWFVAIGATGPNARFLTFDSFPLTLQAAIAGRGMALGWGRTVGDLVAEGKLVRPCAESVHRPADMSVFQGSRRGPRKAVQALREWLQQQLVDG
ncbi:LysR substrate-binding domain-containing protein [Aquamicrobium lusatiense]|uniref:LysR substrate-binding domain-containing protein n=1 Tax=Aquamicrobium lusatiense TaxID=89772 RepID=UPI00245825B5|nr:LysR substrate-binding domain-containing protein [Aquamicrobium lusatiense]MDH4992096.1 LysR substrate-binding domain-containing protein [Aquamicrobium lusatiense]